MIVFTDVLEFDSNSFFLTIDEPGLLKNVDQLFNLLPQISNLIMNGDNNRAVKTAIHSSDRNRIKAILKTISKPKFSITAFGVTFSMG